MARAQAEEALELARAYGWDWLVPMILGNLGLAAADQGDTGQAAALLGESLELGRARGNLGDVGAALEGLARVAAAGGQTRSAARLFGVAAAIRDEVGFPQPSFESAYYQRFIDALRTSLGAERFSAELAAGRALSLEAAFGEAGEIAVSLAAPPAMVATNPPPVPFGLTPRERQILCLLVAGESNRAIADRLFISPVTVKRHLANLYAKLGVDSRAKAVAFARRRGLA